MGESFEEFRRSFSYGSRNDLSFKFLSHLSDEAAAGFFQELLRLIGEAYDTGDVEPFIRLAYEAQVQAYAPKGPARWAYEDAPFASLRKPLAEGRLLLITSSGHFVAGCDPEPFGMAGMTQEQAIERIKDFSRGAPELSRLPRGTAPANLRVRHPGFDLRSTERDHNVTLPRDRLMEAEASGRIGELAPEMFSFPGLTDQNRLLEVLPGWVDMVGAMEVDAALLVPI